MPYSDPQTTHNPATSTVAPAAWGDAVRDALEYLARNRPHARVYNSTTQSLTTATQTAITFDSERVDVGGMHSTVTNTSRLTVPTGEGGWYRLGGCIEFAANATGYRNVSIRINGTTYVAVQTSVSAGAGTGHRVMVACEYQMAAGDYAELIGFQTSGGNLNSSNAANYAPEFWACWSAV